jgi:hypothetical protein
MLTNITHKAIPCAWAGVKPRHFFEMTMLFWGWDESNQQVLKLTD